jgi:Xaa-Pro aminopeptidase
MEPIDIIPTPTAEIDARIRGLQEALRRDDFYGAVLLHNPNLFYYAGTVQDGFLWVPAEGEPLLVVRKHVDKARRETPLRRWLHIKSMKQVEDVFREPDPPDGARLGMEFDVVPVTTWRKWRTWVPGVAFEDISSLPLKQRAVKSAFELDLLRRAGGIVASTVPRAAEWFEPGMTEQALSARLVHEMRLLGHHGFIRTRNWRSEIYVGGTVSCGTSSGVPWPFDGPVAMQSRFPAITSLNSTRVIKPNQPVLIDMLGAFNGYHYDFSRTFVQGRLDPVLVRAHDTAVRIRDALVKAMRPGALPEDLYLTALSMADEAGFADGFMNYGMNQVRFVGHGIGLELDEGLVLARRFREPLAAGNVIALEPKFIFPALGGVGVEDTVLVTERGGEILAPCPARIYPLA